MVFPQIGLLSKSQKASDGFILFHPNSSFNTFLIDKEGELINQWAGDRFPGRSVYLLEDGNLLRTGDAENSNFSAGGRGGYIEIVDWNGNLVWNYSLSNFQECHHHDVQFLPNGNILAIIWVRITRDEAVANGRNPALIDEYLWSESIIEFKPVGKSSIEEVWRWNVWDHLVQDFDSTKANYGDVETNFRKIDLNLTRGSDFDPTDWLHFNAIDYNAELDQIVISSPFINEIWVIDHSTTPMEAQGSTGGNSGMGGGLLFRWGNPTNYLSDTDMQRAFYGQHNPEWLKINNQWKISIFNNGSGREEEFSTVELIDLPINGQGLYELDVTGRFLPLEPSFVYQREGFYSRIISGAQFIEENQFIVCEGVEGRFFEVDRVTDEVVWEYVNPINDTFNCSKDQAEISSNAVFRAYQYSNDYSGILNMEPQGQLQDLGCPLLSNVSEVEDQLNYDGNSFYFTNQSEGLWSIYNMSGQLLSSQFGSSISGLGLEGVLILHYQNNSIHIQKKFFLQ